MTKEEKYVKLMQMYPSLTPESIKHMTPYVQSVLLNPPIEKTLTFATEEAYARHLAGLS